jgi:alkylated DNA repair dioxygenase AlkB
MSSFSNLLPADGEVFYFPNFISVKESDDFLIALKQHVLWKHEPIRMFGKWIYQPRLTALYGDPNIPYSYSGIQMQATPYLPILVNIKNRIEQKISHPFTHVLLNYYRNGQDSMGWHRDNEKSLGKEPIIASLSFGETRTFQMRRYDNKSNKVNIELEHGSLLIMKGKSQECWEHQLPKSKGIFGERINLTFRNLIL